MAIYRLILQTSPGRVDTGASYPGCSQNNTVPCKPMQFLSIKDAIAYAEAHGETPISVGSVEETWRIIAGTQPIQQSQILSSGLFGGMDMTTMLLIGAGLIFLVPALFKKRG